MAIKFKRPGESEPEVFGNENFGIPSDCTKKQKFSTFKLIFYIIAVAAICVTGYKYYNDAVDRYLPEITFDKTSQPLIYNTSSGIVLKTQKGVSYEVAAATDNSDSSSAIRCAAMGKSVFFLTQNKEHNKKYDLCYYNISTDSVSVIDTCVSDFKIDEDGKYVVYKKGTELYFSDLKDKHIVFNGVTEYYLSDNNQVIIFFTNNGTVMYSCSTAKDEQPSLIDYGITKVVSAKDNHINVYYIKDSKLYLKEYGNMRKMIASDVLDALMVGNSVYYATTETYERPITDFFTDDLKDSDSQLMPPDGTDFIKEVDGLSFFDEDAFSEANEEYDKKLLRDEIREYFAETPVETEGLSLYSYIDGTSKLVDTHLASSILSRKSNKNIFLYKKYDLQSEEKKDIQELETLEESIISAQEQLDISHDIDMYIAKEGKEPFFAFEESPYMQIEISLDAKFLYCIEINESGTENILNRYEIGSSSLRGKTKISTNVTDFAIDGSDSLAVMVFCGNKFSFYYENKLTELSENSCRDFFFVDGTLFFFDEYDNVAKSGDLCTIRNGKVSVIDTNVHSFKVRKYNSVSYIKDYNPEDKTGTLYIKDGKTVKRQDNYVGDIIN